MRKGQFLSALDPRKSNSSTPRSWSTSWDTHWGLTCCGSTRRTSAKTRRLTLRTIGGLLSYLNMCPESCKVSSGNHRLLCSQQWRWGHVTQLFEHWQLHSYSKRAGEALDPPSSCRKDVCVAARLGTYHSSQMTWRTSSLHLTFGRCDTGWHWMLGAEPGETLLIFPFLASLFFVPDYFLF